MSTLPRMAATALELTAPSAMRTALAMLAIALALATPGANAQRLVDPMRPPGAEAFPGTRTATTAPELQTIVIRPDLRYAVIDGQTVGVGQRIGDARVTRIEETRVLITGPSGTTELRLFPHVEKHAAIEGPTAKVRVRNTNTRVARVEETHARFGSEPGATGSRMIPLVDAKTASLPPKPHGESK